MKYPDDWSRSEIGNLVFPDEPICYGVLKPGDFHHNGIPLVRIVDIVNNLVHEEDLFRISNKLDNEFKRSRLKGGELLVSIQGTVGRVALAPACLAGANISRTIARVSIDAEIADKLYIRQWLLSGDGEHVIRDAILGTTRDSLNLSVLRKIEVPHPQNIAEQTKIAEVLYKVDQAIEQTESLIAKQQRIKTGLMQDILTRGIDEHGNLRSEETHEFKDSPLGRIPVKWEVTPIEQKIGALIDYRGKTPKKVSSGIPLITAKNVRDGYLDEDPREYIAEKNYDSWMTRGIPTAGDILLTTEAPMGNVARVPNYRIALAQRLLTLQPKDGESISDFIFWMLHWKNSIQRLEKLTSGSTVVGVKQSVFRKVEFTFPSVIEQRRICNILNSHEKTLSDQITYFKKLRSLRTALMQDLLTGKKRVTPLMNDMEVSS